MGANSSASLDLILPRVLAGDSWRGGGRRAGKVSIFFSLSLMAARSLTVEPKDTSFRQRSSVALDRPERCLVSMFWLFLP